MTLKELETQLLALTPEEKAQARQILTQTFSKRSALPECRQVLLYAIKKAQDKYRFQLSEFTQISGQTATGRGLHAFRPYNM